MTSINSELVVDANVLRRNILFIKNKILNTSKFLSVIKSDAYGHFLSSIISDIDDISDGYGVVRIDEAIKIRDISKKKILLMQGVYSHEDLKIARDKNFDIVVHNMDQFNMIKDLKIFSNIWFKVNTGMNRLGFEISEFEDIYDRYLFNKEFVLMSHLASSNDKTSSSNAKQFKVFDALSKKMNPKVKKSIANTGCIMNYPEYTYDWVRCGIGIYGGYLHDKRLETAMTLRSPIINVRPIQKGEKVGYDGRAVAEYDMRIASVYLGYADGLPVNIKDGTSVMINGSEAQVFGKVSMDLTTIDVTNIPNCKSGDWCEFFSPKFHISEISKTNKLVTYFFMTSIKSRVKKIYKSSN
tara:strand:+ start:50103 stop:51164 length:1062 start_codon:yes stop_codon:yes gene_type:complete